MKNKQVKKNRSQAFTLVELIIVIVVISILTAIVAFSVVNVQKRARDSQRSTSTNIIAESLESYYNKNGEYPSCSALTQSADTVTSTILQGINSDVLEAPSTSPANGNSIVCSDVTSSSSSDIYGFVGDGSSACQTGSSCLQWTLKYKEEATGQVITIQSRHSASIASSGTETITAANAGTSQINASWNVVSNALSYQLQVSPNSDMSSATSTNYTTTSTTVAGLTQGKKYYLRVAPVAVNGQGNWSNTASAITSINPPTPAPTITAAMSNSTTATGTASANGGVCAAGTTLELAIQYNSTYTSTPGSWSSYAVGSVRNQAANQGYKYTFQAGTRCIGSDASSSYATASASVLRQIDQPAAPTVGVAARPVPSTWSAGYNYYVTLNNSCPTNTGVGGGKMKVREYGYSGAQAFDFTTTEPAAGFTDWWYLGWANGDNSEPVTYVTSYNCTSGAGGNSVYSPTTSTPLTIVCEAARQSYSANPRCDQAGQIQGNMPYGN